MRGWLAVLATAGVLVVSPVRAACTPWSAWEAFQARFISGDGRVIDRAHKDQRTVSEAQAYALLFALIANDRAGFAQLLRWTIDKLARGDLSQYLPAWTWGRRPDQGWGVIDPNPASDADVWMAYALLEASRLWSESPYLALANAMIANIAAHEVLDLPRLGTTLLPAPRGFVHADHVRLNPSYLAPQPLRRFAAHSADPRWLAVLASARRVLLESAPQSAAGDWIEWSAERGFAPDRETHGIGSYDAIRVYLWIGMLDAADPDRRALLAHYAPVARLFAADGRPPEQIDITTGHTRGDGPGGFSAALLPFFHALGDFGAVAQQKVHLATLSTTDQPRYYDQVLRLWGEGWDAGHYRFGPDGSLLPRWASGC